MALRAPLRPKNEERFMPTAEKQASVLPSLAKNVTAIPSMDKKHTTIPSNGFSVQYEEIWHDGQKLRPGVWLHSTWDSKLGEQSTHEWICGPLEVEAITRSLQSTDYGRLISFINLDGQERKWAMPNLLLAGKSDSILGTLLTMGLDVSYEHRTKVTAFIAGQRPSARVIAATETGWHGDKLFIMPHQNIGEGQAVYQSEDATQDDYRVGGTLHGWQSSIGSMCAGNPLLLLSICTSLAGPILFHVQMKGGGFHLVGDSSTGKTIATIAGASVWGHGEKFLRTWLATGNGLEGIANERNDTILALDELGEADAREVGAVVYALANGTGKTRATRSGSAKKTKRWRIMLFSTGELGLGAFMAEGGQRIRAGQEIRLLDISAYRTHGAWDNLHGMEDGRRFSDAIRKGSMTHYGHAGPEFVRRLIESEELCQLSDLLDKFRDQYPCCSGQESRAAERFALVAMTGELAISFGILPLPAGAAREAILELFASWRAVRGEGPSENRKVLDSISNFIARHAETRFQSAAVGSPAVRDRAGLWEEAADGSRLYLFNRSGLEEAAKGYDLGRVVRALDSVGAIAKREPGKNQAQKRLPEGGKDRFYWINPELLSRPD